jgi:hypothetical protein
MSVTVFTAMLTLREAHPPLITILDQAEARLATLLSQRRPPGAGTEPEEQYTKENPEVVSTADLDKAIGNKKLLPEEEALAKCFLIATVKINLKWADHPERVQHEMEGACANEVNEVVRLDGESMAEGIALNIGLAAGSLVARVKAGTLVLPDIQ